MGKKRYIGTVIIEEILNNMHAGAERLYYTVQVPSIYHIYLHQADYDKLLPIENKIIAETKRALDDELASQNHASQRNAPNLLNNLRGGWQAVLSFFGKRTKHTDLALKYEKGAGDWRIALYPDSVNDLKVGDVVVESELALAANVELGAGLVTKTIRTIRLDGMTKSFEVKGDSASRKREAGNGTKSQVVLAGTLPSPVTGIDAFASIRYKDKQGNWHDYLMQKEKVNIGRGNEPDAAPSYWVDLALDSDADVSPLHIQLFFDSTLRKFFIKDLSTLGTRVNGRLIKSSIGNKNGRTVDLNVLEELPADSRISLANKIILDFKSLVTD